MAIHVEHERLPSSRGPTTPAWIIGLVVIAVVAAVGAGVLLRAGDEPKPKAQAPPTGAVTAPPELGGAPVPGSASARLSRYVLEDLTGPGISARFDDLGSEVWTLSDVADTFQVATKRLQEAGFVDAYGSGFATPGWFGTGDGPALDLISVAMLFEDGRGASAAMDAFHPDGIFGRWQIVPARDLGKDGYGVTGSVDGKPTTAYIWQVRHVVLIAASQGALSLDVLREVATEMDSKASV